jgi:hypothetical protein
MRTLDRLVAGTAAVVLMLSASLLSSITPSKADSEASSEAGLEAPVVPGGRRYWRQQQLQEQRQQLQQQKTQLQQERQRLRQSRMQQGNKRAGGPVIRTYGWRNRRNGQQSQQPLATQSSQSSVQPYSQHYSQGQQVQTQPPQGQPVRQQ